jgi:hypothetical protein
MFVNYEQGNWVEFLPTAFVQSGDTSAGGPGAMEMMEALDVWRSVHHVTR